MLRISRKILHCGVLLLTFVALMGVNVRQLQCVHTNADHLEVWGVQTDDCPCSDGCCDHCHKNIRHHFYKLTDVSLAEGQVELERVWFCLPEYAPVILPYSVYVGEIVEPYDGELPDIPIVRAMLCTYLC